MLAQLTRLRGAALDIFFPQYCVGCGKEGLFICDTCLDTLPYLEHPFCPLCGLPHANAGLCRNCLDWKADIDGIRSPFKFEGVIRTAIHQLKYNNLRAIAPTLAHLMSKYVLENVIDINLIIPVPLHKKRLRDRGYNQSYLLAKELSKLMDVQLDDTSLSRERYVLPQARTHSVEERRANVSNVFTCRAQNVSGKKILLIDDVATSGATMNACAAVLKSAGAIHVWGLALAREI